MKMPSIKKVFLSLISFILISFYAHSANVAIVTSKATPFAQDVIDQINNALKQSFSQVQINTIYTDDGNFIEKLKNTPYDIICAFGDLSAQIAKALPQTPVVFSMAMENSAGDIAAIRKTGDVNLTGVFLSPEPKEQVNIIKKVLPNIQAIYMFHDGVSKGVCDSITSLQSTISFNPQKVENANKIPAAINALSFKNNNAFWILPDSTIYNKDSIFFILNYSMEKRVPIIGFASNVVKAGALLGYVFDYDDIGIQTAEIIAQLLNGASAKEISPQRVRKVGYALNLKIADYLGIKITPDVIKGASEVIR